MAEVVVAGLGGWRADRVRICAGRSPVRGCARDGDAARARMRDAASTAAQAGIADGNRAEDVVISVEISVGLPEPPAAICVESIVEDAEAKGDLLNEAAHRYADAILASNTSSISITRLGELAGAPERVVGTHYWNPPVLMPLVELIAGEATEPAALDTMERTLREMGKQPVRVKRDVPGFVWNRLQLALVREAAWLAEKGVAEPEDIDRIVRDGLARRWRFMGPFETMALGGPAVFERIAANLFPVLSDARTLNDVERGCRPTTSYQPCENDAIAD